MNPDNLHSDPKELQKVFLYQNRIFLDAVRNRKPLEEILLQYDKVKSLFETIKHEHSYSNAELV